MPSFILPSCPFTICPGVGKVLQHEQFFYQILFFIIDKNTQSIIEYLQYCVYTLHLPLSLIQYYINNVPSMSYETSKKCQLLLANCETMFDINTTMNPTSSNIPNGLYDCGIDIDYPIHKHYNSNIHVINKTQEVINKTQEEVTKTTKVSKYHCINDNGYI